IEGLQALRGIARISAATIVAEVGLLSRFARAKQLMGYSGVVSREHSSGDRIRRGAITKTGNAHLRRILVEAAWSYRYRPNLGSTIRAPGQRQPRGAGDCLEAPAPSALSLRAPRWARQAEAAGGDGGRPRARWFYLGGRGADREAAGHRRSPRSLGRKKQWWSRAASSRASRGKKDPR